MLKQCYLIILLFVYTAFYTSETICVASKMGNKFFKKKVKVINEISKKDLLKNPHLDLSGKFVISFDRFLQLPYITVSLEGYFQTQIHLGLENVAAPINSMPNVSFSNTSSVDTVH